MKELNELVVKSHDSFEKACDQLERVQEVVPVSTGQVVSIEAVPGRLFDMLARAQVNLGTSSGAKVPIGRHGEGTQSLAVLMLFSAFLETIKSGAPIIALEEPEAHLHPSAIRALWSVIDSIPGQKIISTHSGDLLSEVPVRCVRRLVRESGGIKLHQLKPGTLSDDEERKFNFHIRFSRGELLFARCWFLVEGETEVTLLPEIARHLGIGLEKLGVRCVPHRNAGISLFLSVARDFGIQYCVLADNDSQGTADQKHVMELAPSARLKEILHVMPEPDIEQHLCACGFGDVYASYLSPQTQTQVTVAPGHPDYWMQVLKAIKKSYSKPSAASEVLKRIQDGKAHVPTLFQHALESSVRLATQ